MAAIATLAGCAKPPPPPPPPPPVIVIPPQPQPPSGAPTNLDVPPVDAQGVRQTVNTHISAAQTIWNLRSAYNVAALNCLDPKYAQIVVNYRAFLKTHAKKLTAANNAVDQEFRNRYGKSFVAPREAFMTQVYNYFALPPTLPDFCDAALAMSNEGRDVKPDELESFAVRSLPALEQVFSRFYRSYEQYLADLAAWQAKYNVPTVTVLPGAAGPRPPATTQPPPVIIQLPAAPSTAPAPKK